MIGKFLFFLSAASATFIGLSAGAVTTRQNVDIIVTHGAPLTTFTFVNDRMESPTLETRTKS